MIFERANKKKHTHTSSSSSTNVHLKRLFRFGKNWFSSLSTDFQFLFCCQLGECIDISGRYAYFLFLYLPCRFTLKSPGSHHARNLSHIATWLRAKWLPSEQTGCLLESSLFIGIDINNNDSFEYMKLKFFEIFSRPTCFLGYFLAIWESRGCKKKQKIKWRKNTNIHCWPIIPWDYKISLKKIRLWNLFNPRSDEHQIE